MSSKSTKLSLKKKSGRIYHPESKLVVKSKDDKRNVIGRFDESFTFIPLDSTAVELCEEWDQFDFTYDKSLLKKEESDSDSDDEEDDEPKKEESDSEKEDDEQESDSEDEAEEPQPKKKSKSKSKKEENNMDEFAALLARQNKELQDFVNGNSQSSEVESLKEENQKLQEELKKVKAKLKNVLTAMQENL